MSAAVIPTLEQLRVLVDRAERGRLTGAEARVLRAGIEALSAAAVPSPGIPHETAERPRGRESAPDRS